MSTFDALVDAAIDTDSPMTGANKITPANDSVAEILRTRDDYLYEITRRQATPSSIGGVTSDLIPPHAVATYTGAATIPANDGLAIASLKRSVEAVGVLEITDSIPTIQQARVMLNFTAAGNVGIPTVGLDLVVTEGSGTPGVTRVVTRFYVDEPDLWIWFSLQGGVAVSPFAANISYAVSVWRA